MEDDREAAQKAARAMLDAFTSVGAMWYDLTITTGQGAKVRFRPNVTRTAMERSLPGLLDTAARDGHNVILRPRGSGMQFIQLDDLNADRLDSVLANAFLALETSPQSFQAWIVLPADKADEDFARRLRKGSGADPSASGATRCAGSYNFKIRHAPDFPQVQIAASNPGHIATREQLQAAGLVADRELPPARVSPLLAPRRSGSRGPAWPSYQKCLDGAPLNHSQTGPDTSKADFMFCLLAQDWGHSQDATAARLMEESPKAQQNGEKYARLTAEKAAQAVTRNRSR